VDAFAMVVDSYRQLLLNCLLPNYILVKKLFYFERLGNLVRSAGRSFYLVVFENRIANGNALVANIRTRVITRGRDELSDYVLTFMTKRTSQSIIGSGTLHAGILLFRRDMDLDARVIPSPLG